MSQANVELVRAIYDDWMRGEPGLDKFDPDISMFESETLPGAVSAVGIDAVRHYMESFGKYWEQIRFEPQEFIEAGDQVVVVARLVGRGRSSGVDVERIWAYVWTVRGGRALRLEGYVDRAEALTAVGLER